MLDLRPLVLQLADRIGLKKQLNDALPPDVGQLEVADSKDLDTARTVVQLIVGLAWLFTFGTLALFGLAVYLAKGRRWMVMLGYGLGLIAAGLAAIAVRSALKGLFVDSLANTEAANVPAEHAWDIGTSLLQSIATTVVIYGVLFVIAAFLASPARIRGRDPPGVRADAARSSRVSSGRVFGAVALIGLIVWPPAGTRQLVLTLAADRAGRRRPRGAAAGRPPASSPGAKPGDWVLGRCASASSRASARDAAAGSARR